MVGDGLGLLVDCLGCLYPRQQQGLPHDLWWIWRSMLIKIMRNLTGTIRLIRCWLITLGELLSSLASLAPGVALAPILNERGVRVNHWSRLRWKLQLAGKTSWRRRSRNPDLLHRSISEGSVWYRNAHRDPPESASKSRRGCGGGGHGHRIKITRSIRMAFV